MAGRSSDSESTIADIHAAPRATAQQPETDEKTVNGADGDVQRGHSSYASSSEPAHASSPLKTDVEAAPDVWDWDTDPANPWNWPAGKKWRQVLSISASAFAASIGTSIVAPGHAEVMAEFGVSSTVAILPLSTYVLALALGPVVGGPLSETIGRHYVFVLGNVLGALFTMGAGFAPNIAGLSVLRFLAGFAFGPSLAVSAGTINETFRPAERAVSSALFILVPFLGPGLGPVIGSFVTNRKGWRWTQWTLVFFSIFAIACSVFVATETYHPVLRRRRAKELGRTDELPPKPRASQAVRMFLTVALLRPLHMLVAEPIVTSVCLYVAAEFATLFSFFAGVPFVFSRVYDFTLEETGLVFLSIVVGCLLGLITIIACNILLYLPQVPRHPPNCVPPEHRLYPAMLGSIGLPIGLFWFAWTARPTVSWASPACAIVPFAWGNLCIFVSCIQYTTDVYLGTTVASAASANSLARYFLAAAFPLFTVQMYTNLGIGWASSVLGFIAIALLPVPWVLFRFGKKIRSMSKYETVPY